MLDDYLYIVKNCFNNNSSFEIMRAQGFESFINNDIGDYTIAEILATFTD